MAGSLVFGLLFPVEVDPRANVLPAPPAVTMLSPILTLYTIATNGPLQAYGYRYSNAQYSPPGGGGQVCKPMPGGGASCYSNGGTLTSGPTNGAYQQASPASGTTIPSGLFNGWQYWQATIAMQLAICLAALALSAYVLPPLRRFRVRPMAAQAPAAT
jgi:hypothetical protein